MQHFLVCTYKFQDFAQSQTNFVRSHNRETVTFRNSAWVWRLSLQILQDKGDLLDNLGQENLLTSESSTSGVFTANLTSLYCNTLH